MPGNTEEQQAPMQTTSSRYLRRDSLQDLLERLFPGQTDFGIQVNCLKLAHRAQG